eukprot:2447537-Pleurochrysis_carterae.AAC.2
MEVCTFHYASAVVSTKLQQAFRPDVGTVTPNGQRRFDLEPAPRGHSSRIEQCQSVFESHPLMRRASVVR